MASGESPRLKLSSDLSKDERDGRVEARKRERSRIESVRTAQRKRLPPPLDPLMTAFYTEAEYGKTLQWKRNSRGLVYPLKAVYPLTEAGFRQSGVGYDASNDSGQVSDIDMEDLAGDRGTDEDESVS